MKKAFNKFILNYLTKTPLVFLVLLTGMFLFLSDGSPLYSILCGISNDISLKFLTESKLDTLTTVSVTLSGFCVTIMSVFGVGVSNATIEISKNGLSTEFMLYAIEATISSFILFGITVFMDLINSSYIVLLYILIILWAIFNFIRFSIVVLAMYKNNINNVHREIEEEEKYKENIQKLLQTIIDNQVINRNKESDEHFDKMIKISKSHLENSKDLSGELDYCKPDQSE